MFRAKRGKKTLSLNLEIGAGDEMIEGFVAYGEEFGFHSKVMRSLERIFTRVIVRSLTLLKTILTAVENRLEEGAVRLKGRN